MWFFFYLENHRRFLEFPMTYTLDHADAEVLVETLSDSRNRISVKMKSKDIFMPTSMFETIYPIELIKKILAVKGPAYLCDEIMRDESPEYVQRHLKFDVLGYLGPDDFIKKTILDFGCGSGASTMVLSRMLPNVSITGVELDKDLLDIAHERSRFYNAGQRVRFMLSPDGNSLPSGIGQFDFIFMNAVYEHLLPEERVSILSLLWNNLASDGVLFINQTPYRWFPIETHTTSGLPLINYMPDSIAGFYARRLSRRNLVNASWSELLRLGIRGGSVSEILQILKSNSFSPVLLDPCRLGLSDRIDMWYAVLNQTRHSGLKRSLFAVFKSIKFLTGVTFLPTLSLAIRKVHP
jgi:SAM-dependent methyltransferase